MTEQDGTILDDDASVSLVPIDENGAVAVFARSPESARAVLDTLRPGTASTNVARLAFDTAVDGLGLSGAAVSGATSAATALASLQGVVQFAPETMALLNNGHHLMQAAATGQQMGTVVNSAGVVVANARFVPLGQAATVGSVAVALGPAVALAAIQFQLNRLENLLGEVKLITQSLLAEARTERWAEVEARIDRINRELGWVIELGTVPAHLIENIAGDAVALHAFAIATTELLASRVEDLSGRIRARDKRERLELQAQAIARDAVDLSLAADAWMAVETLRSFHIQQDSDPVAQRYGERVYGHALSTADTWRAQANDTLTDVQRLLSRIAAQEPNVLRRNDRRSASIARRVSNALAMALPEVEPRRLRTPDGTPGLDADAAALVLQEARWVLEPDADIEALVAVNINGEPGFRLETSERVLVGETAKFLAAGEYVVLGAAEDEDALLAKAGVTLDYSTPDALLVRRGKRAASDVVTGVDKAFGSARRRLGRPAGDGSSTDLDVLL